jgi:hypothetical protein
LNHLHHPLSFRHPYGAFSKAGGNGFGGEAGAALAFLCFKISKPSDRLAGDVDADVLGCAVRIAD